MTRQGGEVEPTRGSTTERSSMSGTHEPPAGRRSLRRTAAITALLLAVLIGFDLAQPPQQQLSARGVLAAIDLYQATLSKAMPTLGVSCRFTPTCSHYGEAAIRARGAGIGILLTLRRLGRCGPWTARGTYDPPPEPVARMEP